VGWAGKILAFWVAFGGVLALRIRWIWPNRPASGAAWRVMPVMVADDIKNVDSHKEDEIFGRFLLLSQTKVVATSQRR
jgi:hypothetical protein